MKKYKPGLSFHLLFRLKKYLIIFTLLILLFKCAPALYLPSISDEYKSNISLDSLIKGRKLYINNCGACHNLYLPEKFTSREWSYNVERMQDRAKIDSVQKELIVSYLKIKSKN
jgi:hypothetical protein